MIILIWVVTILMFGTSLLVPRRRRVSWQYVVWAVPSAIFFFWVAFTHADEVEPWFARIALPSLVLAIFRMRMFWPRRHTSGLPRG